MSGRSLLLGTLGALLLISFCPATQVIAASDVAETIDTVYVPAAPPEAKTEICPPAPEPHAIWIAGHWKWQGNMYVWETGHWEKEPPGKWIPGSWVKTPRGYMWVAGRWVNDPEKMGKRWVKGHWAKHKGSRVWVAGHWEP